MPIMPTLATVAFEQRVDGLGGRVGDELDAVGADLPRQLVDDVHDAGRDAVDVLVRGGHDGVRDDRAGVGVERDGFGERPADVDADPNRHGSVVRVDERRLGVDRGRRGRRRCRCAGRSRGRITNMYNAPSRYTVMSASCAVMVSRLGQ